MAINVSQAFHRTSANPVDDTMTLSLAEMLTVNDNLMPAKYFTVCQDDGYIYLYDKSATPSATSGKFKKFEGGGGTSGSGELYTVTLLASAWASNSQTLTVTGLKADDNGVVGMLNTATDAQLEAARNAVITVTTQAANAVTFSCENEPEIDIPVGILVGGGSGGSGSGGHTIVNESGTDMTAREKLKFVGATVTDDSTNDTTVVTVDSDTIQYATMPTASVDNLGAIVQYTGATTATYTNGYFYKCVTDGSAYSWETVKTQSDSDLQPKTLDTAITIGGTSRTTVEGALGALNTVDGAKADTTAIAPAFDDTATYAIGDIVSYEGKVYEFTAAHTGAWAAADVAETDVTEMTESLSAAELQAIEDAFDATTLQSGQFASTYDIIDLRGTERIVGKVIEADGTEKVLYEKTIAINSTVTKNAPITVISLSSSNIETIMSYFGNGTETVSSSNQRLFNSMMGHLFTEGDYIKYFSNYDNIYVKNITIRYTKTT